MKTTLDLDAELLTRAKITAAQRRTTLKALVEHALAREIAPSGDSEKSTGNHWVEMGADGIPRLKARSTTVTTSAIRELMDQEGI